MKLHSFSEVTCLIRPCFLCPKCDLFIQDLLYIFYITFMAFNATFNNISALIIDMSVNWHVSQFFERAINVQLSSYINNVFHPSLSAFRSSFGCQPALLKNCGRLVTGIGWKKNIAAILMDISKAFDCLHIIFW